MLGHDAHDVQLIRISNSMCNGEVRFRQGRECISVVQGNGREHPFMDIGGFARQKMLFFHDMDAKIAMIFRFGIAERAPTDILGESSCIMVECRKQGRPSLLGIKPFLSDDGTGMS